MPLRSTAGNENFMRLGECAAAYLNSRTLVLAPAPAALAPPKGPRSFLASSFRDYRARNSISACVFLIMDEARGNSTGKLRRNKNTFCCSNYISQNIFSIVSIQNSFVWGFREIIGSRKIPALRPGNRRSGGLPTAGTLKQLENNAIQRLAS